MSEHLQLRDLLGPYVMGALGPEEERKVEEHLESCLSCREEVSDLRLAHERLTDLVNMEERPPRELKDRIMTRMPRRETRWVPLAAAAVLCALAVLGVLYSSGFFAPDEVASSNLKPQTSRPKRAASCACARTIPTPRPNWRSGGCLSPERTNTTNCGSGKRGDA